jgi:anti-sigma B factor antagonist
MGPCGQHWSKISRLAASVQSQFRVDRVEVHREGRAAVIAVNGELDLASGPRLDDELRRAADSGVELLVVDLRGVEFIDSTGLSILVKAHQHAVSEGHEFALVRGPQQVQRLLDLTGVGERMTLIDTPEELLGGN